jgi:cytochrome P450
LSRHQKHLVPHDDFLKLLALSWEETLADIVQCSFAPLEYQMASDVLGLLLVEPPRLVGWVHLVLSRHQNHLPHDNYLKLMAFSLEETLPDIVQSSFAPLECQMASDVLGLLLVEPPRLVGWFHLVLSHHQKHLPHDNFLKLLALSLEETLPDIVQCSFAPLEYQMPSDDLVLLLVEPPRLVGWVHLVLSRH